MQDTSSDDFDLSADEPTRLARVRSAVSTLIGAVVALCLLMALGVWFYRLGVRDAQNVPIIRAALEPAKTRPEDPGGAIAPHQEITSYEVAEVASPASASAAVVAPPPAQPTREDVAMADLAPTPKPAVAPEPEPDPAIVQQPTPRAAAPADPATSEETEVAALTVPAAPVEPEPEPAAQPEPEPETTAQPEPEPSPAEVEDATALAPARAPVALTRPSNLLARVETASQEAAASKVDLARSAAQSRVQIQLAADPNEDYIRRKWRTVSRANADVLRDRALAVQTTKSGGKTFYRLRVGPFKDAAEARAVCQALKARGQDCIVARNG